MNRQTTRSPDWRIPVDSLEPGQCRGFTLEVDGSEVEAFVVNGDTGPHAYVNSCPHTGVALDWMPDRFLDLKGEYIQCAMHGALFEIDTGLCVYGPCLNRKLEKLEVERDQDEIRVFY
jgi:nitrite reductase/ring-hydroxylating ferredoxin subunit